MIVCCGKVRFRGTDDAAASCEANDRKAANFLLATTIDGEGALKGVLGNNIKYVGFTRSFAEVRKQRERALRLGTVLSVLRRLWQVRHVRGMATALSAKAVLMLAYFRAVEGGVGEFALIGEILR